MTWSMSLAQGRRADWERASLAFCHAELKRGIDIVLDATGFDRDLAAADLVITGEGKIDAQTRFGKAPAGVLRRARAAGKPVAALAGIVEGDRAGITLVLKGSWT